MQQRVTAQVVEFVERRIAVDQLGTADREEVLGHQPVGAGPIPLAATVAHGDIDVLAGEVGEMLGGVNAQIDVRIGLAESAEARHQPLRRNRRQGGDGQGAPVIVVANLLGSIGQQIEGLAQGRPIVLARVGQQQRPVETAKQRHPEPLLQRLDLMADGRLGDVELLRRLGKAQVPGGGLEGTHGVQRR